MIILRIIIMKKWSLLFGLFFLGIMLFSTPVDAIPFFFTCVYEYDGEGGSWVFGGSAPYECICDSGGWQSSCDGPTEVCAGCYGCNWDPDDCSPGSTSPCDTGYEGICSSGDRYCGNCRGWGSCNADVSPGTYSESCNGQDDDCDGVTDEGCGCTDPGACNFDVGSSINDGSCTYDGQVCGTDEGVCSSGIENCAGICIDQITGSDEICDGLDNDCDGSTDEGCGCTDLNACNYNVGSTIDDGTCYYSEQYYDCEGVCINDNNPHNEICDELEIYGCTDPQALNHDPGATVNDGSCDYYNDCYIQGFYNPNSGQGDNPPGGCDGDDLTVLRTSDIIDANVGLLGYSDYHQVLCCDIDSELDGSDPFILLSQEHEAVVQNPDYQEYSYGVSFSEGFTCETKADACSLDEFCVFEYSGPEGQDDNAKISQCGGGYPWKVCCTDVEFELGCTTPDACNYNQNATFADGSCDFGIQCCTMYDEPQYACTLDECLLLDIDGDGVCEGYSEYECYRGTFQPEIEDCDPWTSFGTNYCISQYEEGWFCQVDEYDCGHCFYEEIPWELNNCQTTFGLSSGCAQCEDGDYCEYGGQKSVEWYTYTYQEGCGDSYTVNTDDCLANLNSDSCDNYWNEERDCYFSLEEDVPFFDSISIIFSLMVLISYYVLYSSKIKTFIK